MDVYVARQPIFDNEYNVIAYELLYRDGDVNHFDGNVSDNVATSILLINSFFTFGIDSLIGENRAFINFDSHLIKSGIAELLDKDKVVIEILETVKPDKALLKMIGRLCKLGYTVAIDDYTFDYEHEEITSLCSIVKVDFMDCTRIEIIKIVAKMKKEKKILLAEKIETEAEYLWTKSIGFDYYQGYYFSKPKTIKKKAMPENALQYVRLMGELNAVVPNYDILSKIILIDPGLTYKLLKIVNSNSRIKNQITSIKQALAILGVKEFSRWLSLVMVQNMSNHEKNEALKYAMVRSNFLREIGKNSKLSSYIDELTLLGTLSMIDVILEMEMSEVLKAIPISDDAKNTLLGNDSIFSNAYSIVLDYEKGLFGKLNELAESINYDITNVSNHYLNSVNWAEKIFAEFAL